MKSLVVFLLLLSVVFADLDDALNMLHEHLTEEEVNAEQLLAINKEVEENAVDFSDDLKLVAKGFALVNLYDQNNKPLFLNEKTKNGFKRDKYEGIELERTLFTLQQALIDNAYGNVQDNPDFFTKSFGTSSFFPGDCPAPENPKAILTTQINATQIPGYGFPLGEDKAMARRPTGWYLPPGGVATLNFPSTLVKKGYSIRVGAHSWDLMKKPVVKRLDRVSIVYPINDRNVKIASPLGGGIYLEVPPLAKGGVVTLKAVNVVESPFFHNRSFDKNPSNDLAVELKKPAPWADIETDSYMAQIPRAWAKEMKNPQEMMDAYDAAMKSYSKIVGRPHVRSKSVLYHQVDVTMRGSAFFPGYPMSNFNWDPLNPKVRNGTRWVIEGPEKAPSVLFHEMGHASRITKFKGETEAVVNFPYVYVHNTLYGKSLDLAFAHSFDGNDKMTIDAAAVDRMITDTFRAGQPSNVTNKPGDEVKYQHRGYGMYADIAKLFGWDPLVNFWASDQKNYIAGKNFKFMEGRKYPAEPNRDPTDLRILRLSLEAGVDLTPLAHFWGRHPEKPRDLAAAHRKHKLKPSAEIYDRLMHYKTIIPMTGKQFRQHAKIRYPNVEKPGKGPLATNPLFGHAWYHNMLKTYKEPHGKSAQKELQKIIDLYFPKGRPEES